jgi:hypothetical protein
MQIPLKELSLRELSDFGLELRADTKAYFQSESGILHATTAVSTLQALARSRGAVLRDNCEVISLIDVIDSKTGLRIVLIRARDGECLFLQFGDPIMHPALARRPLVQEGSGLRIESLLLLEHGLRLFSDPYVVYTSSCRSCKLQ